MNVSVRSNPKQCNYILKSVYSLGNFSAPQKVIHEILVDVQNSCASLASPEQSLQDVYHHMLSEIGRHLISEGIIPDQDKLHVS